jgi:flagellar biosynthesis protein FlhF
MSPDSAMLQAPPQTYGDGETRVYRGRSIDELIPRIEAELGADAIVVRRTRGLEGGIGGFFQRRFVEVEAKAGTPSFDMYDEGLGEPVMPPAPAPQSAPPTPGPTDEFAADTLAAAVTSELPEQVVEDPPLPPAVATEPPKSFQELTPDTFGAALAEATAAPNPFGEELDLLDRGMRDLRTAPRDALDRAMHNPQAAPPAARDRDMHDPRTASPPARPTVAVPAALCRERARIEHGLLGVGVSEDLTTELIDAAIAHVLPFAFHASLAEAVRNALAARIPRLALLPAHSATVAVVGPGGSGKTSCCAMLLGAYRRAGILSARCATVMLPGERDEPAVLLSPRIMQPLPIASPDAGQALTQAREEGLLLLDMPPLSPAERPAIERVACLLRELKPDRVVVALPATLGAKAAAQLLSALAPLGASALAITHSDETDQLGIAVQTACDFGLAPEYLLDRSRVRGGLTRIDPTHLAERLLPSERPRS